MPIDASIYQAFAPRQKGALDYAREFAGLDAARQAQEAGALEQQFGRAKFDEYQRGVQKASALEQLMGSMAGKPEAEVLQGLRGAGRYNEAGAMEKSMLEREGKRADIAKAGALTTKALGEAQADALKRYRGALDFVDTPQGAARWLQAQYADPLIAEQMTALGPVEQAMSRIPQTPQEFAQWRQQAGMGMEKFIANQTTQRGQDMTAATAAAGQQVTRETAAQADARIRAEGAANRAVQMRGQAMADARARESNAAAMSKPFEVTGPDGLPLLVQQDRQGNIVPVQGFGPKSGASKPLNDTQAKALLFGTRMQESDKVLTALAEQGAELPSITKRAAESVPLVGGALAMGANMIATPQQQQVEQAQRDFINAVLRRESGAVIADSEFANARKQYFVEPGDSPAVKKQKARNRQLAIDGLLAEVPEGRRTSITPPVAASPDAAAPGAPARVVDFSSLK